MWWIKAELWGFSLTCRRLKLLFVSLWTWNTKDRQMINSGTKRNDRIKVHWTKWKKDPLWLRSEPERFHNIRMLWTELESVMKDEAKWPFTATVFSSLKSSFVASSVVEEAVRWFTEVKVPIQQCRITTLLNFKST